MNVRRWRKKACTGQRVFEEKTGFDILGGPRARRACAEQGSSGSQSKSPKWQKGVTAMVKHVSSRFKPFVPASLVLIGWFSFVLGLSISDMSIIWKLFLLSAARVLP